MLYAVVTAMAMLASCYLLFRRGNVFSTDITPPARLRRWAAAFFAHFQTCLQAANGAKRERVDERYSPKVSELAK